MVSFQLFDRPQNWQAMVEWLWEYGDQFEIARSIPQLDPQRLGKIFGTSKNDDGNYAMGETLICAARGIVPEECIGDELLRLFNAFGDVFKPRIKLNKSPVRDQETEWQRWDIAFQVCGPINSNEAEC